LLLERSCCSTAFLTSAKRVFPPRCCGLPRTWRSLRSIPWCSLERGEGSAGCSSLFTLPVATLGTPRRSYPRASYSPCCRGAVSSVTVDFMSRKELLGPCSLRYCDLLQLAGNKAFCMRRSAVLLPSRNTPQCGRFAVFARNMATGAFFFGDAHGWHGGGVSSP